MPAEFTDSLEFTDFEVADLSSAAFGRKESTLAEHEMPGLMAAHEECARAQPPAGARVTGSQHITVRTAVLALGQKPDTLQSEQAERIGVTAKGPLKSDRYRYCN